MIENINLYWFIHDLDYMKTSLNTFNLYGSTVQNLRNGVSFALGAEITHFTIFSKDHKTKFFQIG